MTKAKKQDNETRTNKASNRVTKVYLVDDHPIVLRGIAQVINDEPGMEVIGDAAEVATALKEITSKKPDVVVVDLTLEDGSGLELIKQIKSSKPEIKMLVTSMHDEELYAERALRAGAMGYLEKKEAVEKMTDAIRTIARGKLFLSSAMSDRVMRQALRGEDDPYRPPTDKLSDRELEVFELVGRGLTVREIAETLHLSPKTIDTYREHIRQKMSLKNNNQLFRKAVLWSLEREKGMAGAEAAE